MTRFQDMILVLQYFIAYKNIFYSHKIQELYFDEASVSHKGSYIKSI